MSHQLLSVLLPQELQQNPLLKLPGYKAPPSAQLGLWEDHDDARILSMGDARNKIGDFIEEVAATYLGGRRLKTDSRMRICPDIEWNPTGKYYAPDPLDTNPIHPAYFESKAAGRSNAFIIYRTRAERDTLVPNLYYCIIFHKTKVYNADNKFLTTVNELRQSLARSIYAMFLIDFPTLHNLLLARPVKTLNTGYVKSGHFAGTRLGYGAEKYGYGIGWTIRRKDMLALCPVTKTLSLHCSERCRTVYRNIVIRNPIQLHIPDYSFLRFIVS